MQLLRETKTFDSKVLESTIKNWINKESLSFGKVMGPLRLALVGDLKGPHLFDILALLGKDESLARIDHAIRVL